MLSLASLTLRNGGPLISRGSAMSQLPRHQGLWVLGQVLTAGVAAALGLWSTHPEIALTLCIAVGAALSNPFRLSAAPLVAGGVTATGLLFNLMEWPAVLGAGAAAGALAAWALPWRTDWLDSVNAALGTLTGSSIGLWAATGVVPETLPAGLAPVLTAALVGVVGSVGLVPVAIRFDQHPTLPTRREVDKALRIPYRPPVYRALDLFGAARKATPDAETRRGLAEVATWVFRLQVTLQARDVELDAIDERDIRDRIARCLEDESEDPVTRERRAATARHLERLLEHRVQLHVERGRIEADVEYALAFLEEARAGLALARELPGETIPERLPEVLDRLRTQAKDGDARRRTARELDKLENTAKAQREQRARIPE